MSEFAYFLRLANKSPLYVGTDHILLIHSSINGNLGSFLLLAIANNAAMNTGVQVSVVVPVHSSLEYIPSSGIAGSYSDSIFTFLRNC